MHKASTESLRALGGLFFDFLRASVVNKSVTLVYSLVKAGIACFTRVAGGVTSRSM
jgi:hypothetical protein